MIFEKIENLFFNGNKFGREDFFDIVFHDAKIEACHEIFGGFAFAYDLFNDGGKCTKHFASGRLFRESHDGFCVVEKEFNVAYARSFEEIDRELENGDIILVFCHFANGSGVKMLSVFHEIKITSVPVWRKGNTNGFFLLGENGFKDVFPCFKTDAFDAFGIISMKKTHDDGQNTDVFRIDAIALLGEG